MISDQNAQFVAFKLALCQLSGATARDLGTTNLRIFDSAFTHTQRSLGVHQNAKVNMINTLDVHLGKMHAAASIYMNRMRACPAAVREIPKRAAAEIDSGVSILPLYA